MEKILTKITLHLHYTSSGDCRICRSGRKTAPEDAHRSWQCKGICFSAVPCLKQAKTSIILRYRTPKEQPWKAALEM